MKQRAIFFKIPGDVVKNILIPYMETFDILMVSLTCKTSFRAFCKEVIEKRFIDELRSMERILEKFLEDSFSMLKDRFDVIRPEVNRRLKKRNLEEVASDFDVFVEICRHGWILTCKNSFDGTFISGEDYRCLRAACYNNRFEVVKFLVSEGAHRPWSSTGKELNPLIVCIERENVLCLDILLRWTEWKSSQDDLSLLRQNEYYLLRRAIHSKRVKSVSFLLYYMSMYHQNPIEENIRKGLFDEVTSSTKTVEFKVPRPREHYWHRNYENLVHVVFEREEENNYLCRNEKKEWIKVRCTCAWKFGAGLVPYGEWMEFYILKPDEKVYKSFLNQTLRPGIVFCKDDVDE